MMMFPTLILLSAIWAIPSFAHIVDSRLPGYGFFWYNPSCGFACYNAISVAMLSCTSMDHSTGGHAHGAGPTTSECRANDSSFLTTMAYCIDSNCPNTVSIWEKEKFWSTSITGDETLLPKWPYSIALEQVKEAPTVAFNSSNVLNETSLLSKASYDIQNNFNLNFDHIEGLQVTYIFVILTIGFGTPIFLAVLGHFPFMTRLFDNIKPWMSRSTIGMYHIQPLPWLIGNAPTIGQALYIFMFFVLNLVLSCVNYDSSQPHPWGFAPRDELLSYIGYRTGHISYALLPLVMLFSGRNNFLLWVTNWSYSTYILLHRWVARIFALHAIIHSLVLLVCYLGTGSYATASKEPYWLWGIVATVLVCFMLVLSHLYFRRLSYEIFLILHIVMAVFVIVGCWYHIVFKWGRNFYVNWLYAACAVWFFDRVFRVVRTAKNGIRHAVVTDIGDGFVRVDVPDLRWDVKPGYVAYAYFPTLNIWRPWENHPFSANSTSIFRNYNHVVAPVAISESESIEHSSSDHARDQEKETIAASTTPRSHTNDGLRDRDTSGVTLIIKKNTGLTRFLKSNSRMLTLLEGPYAHTPNSDILKCDHVLLIGGGIGITGLLPWIRAHPNVKLAWSVKTSAQALVQEVHNVLDGVADKEVAIGQRLDLDRLLRDEADAGYSRVGVVVCGPGGMCDVVRAKVSGLGRGGKTVFELEVHAFSW